MTGQELIAEGQRLAKPCVYLTDVPLHDAPAIAVWGGDGFATPSGGNYKHWFSVDRSILPESIGATAGVLSVYTSEDNDQNGMIVESPFASFALDVVGGIALYARPAMSLPPIDAVFKFGSPNVREWLKANKWLPTKGEDESKYAYNDNFPDKAAVDVYETAWQDQLPLYMGGAHAVLGGWHMPWPDGDWYDLLNKTLVAWTFEESEPWLEVWRNAAQNYTVLQRVT